MVNVESINRERLTRWKAQLNRHNCTPMVLVGVGHAHKEGELIVLTTEERTDEEILLFLMGAIQSLKTKIDSKN